MKTKTIKWLTLGILLVSIISLGFFMQGCNKDSLHNFVEEDSPDNSIFTPDMDAYEKANIIAAPYFEVKDDGLVILNLSEKKALSLGIEKSEYDRLLTEISQANELIIKSQKEGVEVIYCFSGTTNAKRSTSNLKVSANPIPYECSIILDGGGRGSCKVFAPSSEKQIAVNCLSNYVFFTCNGEVVSGGAPKLFSIVGNSGGSKILNLDMSNINIFVSVNVICSGRTTIVSTVGNFI
ncbi:MAG: hypothetical protein LBU91_08455 [Bacteroidales bacterium]|jgi:hypothetical protein|nr:hypothetical protein [Bacteroidales bacterium]